MRGWLAGLALCMLLLIPRASAVDAPKAGGPKSGDPNSSDPVPPEPQLKIRPPKVADQQTNPQTLAETMLERARQFSDIREPNRPPFRMKATFSFIGDELETFQGTYTEYWESDSKWRKEIVVGERKKIEIANGRKLWEIETDQALPDKALRVVFATGIFPARTAKLQFESVESLPGKDGVKCAVTKSIGSSKAKSGLCFDQSTGALLENIIPQWTRYNLADFACAYGEFKNFGGRWFPFEIACRQASHPQMEVHLAELASGVFFDAKLFDQPGNGALELGYCTTDEVAAKPDYTPAPLRPAGMRDRMPPVTLRLVVDPKGKPRDIQVVRPGNKSIDEMAVGTVGRWTFKPATCNGEPMAQRVEFEVAFRAY
jgi:TonB family protein